MSTEEKNVESSSEPVVIENRDDTVINKQEPVIADSKLMIDSTSDLSLNETETTSEAKMEIQDPTISESSAKNEDSCNDKTCDETNLIPVVDLTGKDDDSPQKPQPSDFKSVSRQGSSVSSGFGGQNELSSVEKKSSTSKPPNVKSHPTKRYVYKLKAKSGRVLQYTSTVPIVLKKPVIKLTKMETETKNEYSPKVTENETDDLDSDNSMKENNIKKNEASGENAVPRVVRKRGRPPLSQRTPVIAPDDRNSSDTTDSKDETKTTSAFTMQTRKRQLKFLPDGRVVTMASKRSKIVGGSDSWSGTESETSEEEEDHKSKKTNAAATETKKFSTPQRNANERKGKFKKVFDYESFFREKTGSSLSDGPETVKPKSSVNKIVELQKNSSISIAGASESLASKKTTIDPAQLLSSLIGTPISPSQLNIVKFKPKVIQERTPRSASATPKRVSFQDAMSQKRTAPNSSELAKSTSYKVVSKQTFQKILPKPITLSPEKCTPTVKMSPEKKIIHTASTSVAKVTPANDDSISKFGNFTDTRVVKTRAGPKKLLQKKEDAEGDVPKTVYDLMQNVFDQMPSWNLHVIPDTNSLCIAQVSRGRMGIPILKKSIELNSEFFAKVYVHQLHCKRYDGVYDTENKILTLIRDIDALAA